MLTKLTYSIAYIITSNRFGLERFINESKPGEWLSFCHTGFLYSYPEWQKKWPDGKDCQYHSIETACHCCRKKPERNYAGYGDLYAYISTHRNKPALVLFCKSCREWRNTQYFKPNNSFQYQLPL